MPEEETYDATEGYVTDFNVKLRDIEEKQNLLKERVILLGENLIDEKEDVEDEVSKMRADMASLENEVSKIKLAIERLIESQNNFARKREVEILQRQFEMFQPLELARMSDVRDMIDKAIKKKA